MLIVFIIFLDCTFILQLVLGWKLATTFFKWAVGYSDYDFFLENDRGSRVQKDNFVNYVIQNVEPFLANRALKFQKSAKMTYTLFLIKFEYGYQNISEFYADFETVEKNAINLLTKSYRQKKCAKLEFVFFYTTNL